MSSHGQVNHDLYKWLVNLQILPNNQKYKASGNFQLQSRLQQQLQSGYLVAKLLTTLAQQKGIALNGPLLSSIKNSNTPAARVYNWNILSESLLKLSLNLPRENQKQITSGNFDALILFLIEIQGKINNKKLQKTNPPSSSPQQGLDIKKIHKYQEVQHSETVLQLIIILISKWMGLSSKQAIATLSQSAKYLAHMMVKGVKNSFDEIIQFINDCKSKMDKIMYLAQRDPQRNLQFLLQIFKPSLISRESDVTKAGCSVFKALIYQSFKYNSKNLVYQILCKQGQGFDFVYMGLKRHPYLNFQISEFLYSLVRGILKDFLDIQLKRSINNDQQYVKTIIMIVQPLLLNKQAKQQILSSELFAQWQKNLDNVTNSKLKGKDSSLMTQQTKYLYVQLMYILWMGYYKQLQSNHLEQLLIKITQQLKKNTRSQVYTTRVPSLLKIFSLLDFLATNKNKLAALLYKKIIFLFVQNHNQDEMRQIVLQNLTLIIRKFPTIPLQFLLQPMLKQLTSKQGTTYILNMYDFQFIIELCKHPKMEQYYAITFLDYFIRLYIKSVIYSSLIFRVIEAITARFCQSEQIRQYCLKSTDVSLNNYGMLVMGKTKGNKANYNNSKYQNKQELIINNQKKSLIIELIKHFVSLQHKQMNNEIKQKVATLFIEWYQNRSHYDKGLAAILMQIGDIEEILVEFKQRQMDNDMRQHKVQSPLNSSQNQFESKNFNPISKVQSKLLKYEDYYDVDERNSPIMEDIGLGYKKKKKDHLSKLQLLHSKSKNVKPDPRVLEDIQKIKQKWKLENSRARHQQQEAKKQKKAIKVNQKQLMQRNLSLGYSKLPQLNSDQIMFDFDTVKKKHLKDSLDLINIDVQQERDIKSFQNVIQRYQKYLKSLFSKYASKSAPLTQDKQMSILSFTEIMRLLKQKGLIAKVPKIAINEVITAVNQKRRKQRNVLGGVYEQDFPKFILYYTDLLMKQDTINKKDEPYGLKVQKVILRMLEGQNNVKQLFDPKIQKIKQQLQYNDKIQIPQQYKKVSQTQVQLNYTIQNLDNWVSQPVIDCYQIVDEIIYEALGLHILTPFTSFKQKYTLARKPITIQNSKSVSQKIARPGTQQIQVQKLKLSKDILADSQNSFTKPLKKLSKNVLKKKSQSQRNIMDQQTKKQQQEERDKKRQLHIKKLKQQMLKLREEKSKVEQQKRQKQKEQQQKKRKKQQIRKQYLQQNKKKVLQKKQQDEKKIEQQKRLKQENKQKRKAEVKAKQAEMLEREKKLIQQKRQKMRAKKLDDKDKEKQKQKFNKSKSHDKLLSQMKQIAAQQKMKDLLIKNSIQNGQIKKLIDKNKKNFQDLFEAYWNWQKKMIQLKNLAQMFKDLQTTKYIPPKDIADVYKNVAKGQLLGLQNFIQCIVKLSYRSIVIQQELKQTQKKNQQENNQNKISIAPFQFMLKLIKMNQPNYKQTIIRIKNQKQVK